MKKTKSSNSTAIKMNNNLPKGRVKFNCDFCDQVTHQKRSQYKRKKNHFCSSECYAKFVKRKKESLDERILHI